MKNKHGLRFSIYINDFQSTMIAGKALLVQLLVQLFINLDRRPGLGKNSCRKVCSHTTY